MAKKYDVPALVESCSNYAKENLTPENVCLILDQAADVNEDEIKQKCLKLISKETSNVLKSARFLSLSKDMLRAILGMQCLDVEGEQEIYIACRSWATEASKGMADSSADDTELRNILGECLSLIRFPTMTIETFSGIVAKDDILSDSQKIYVVRDIVNGETISQFSHSKRRHKNDRCYNVFNLAIQHKCSAVHCVKEFLVVSCGIIFTDYTRKRNIFFRITWGK